MTYEELKISIDLNGYENVLPSVGKRCLYLYDHWFVVCDDGDCHLFDRYGNEDDIKKVKEIYEHMIPKDIKKIVIPNSVTNIMTYAFSSCNRLTSVTIPNNVTSIGHGAFYGCSNLTNMTIPNSVTSIGNRVFCYCFKLTSVTIPDSIMSIGYIAFDNCINLTSMMIPNNIMSIGEQAFRSCNNLKSLIFKGKSFDQVKSMYNYPFGIEDESIIKCN